MNYNMFGCYGGGYQGFYGHINNVVFILLEKKKKILMFLSFSSQIQAHI